MPTTTMAGSRRIIFLWLFIEACLCIYHITTETSYMFDWDAYMEQASIFRTGITARNYSDVDSSTSTDRPHPPPYPPPVHHHPVYTYDTMIGDTGPLAYPAMHLWIHTFLSSISSWNAQQWTTEYIPHLNTNATGYERRIHRPTRVLYGLQVLYSILWICTCACVAYVYAECGYLGTSIDNSYNGGEGGGGKGHWLWAWSRNDFIRVIFPSSSSSPFSFSSSSSSLPSSSISSSPLLTLFFLSMTRRARSVYVLGLFNDAWCMTLVWLSVAIFVWCAKREQSDASDSISVIDGGGGDGGGNEESEGMNESAVVGSETERTTTTTTIFAQLISSLFSYWTLGSIVYSLAVGVKMNALLLAPGLLVSYSIVGNARWWSKQQQGADENRRRRRNRNFKQLGRRRTASSLNAQARFALYFILAQLLVCAIVQILIAFPFLLASPSAYLKLSFNFGRSFEQRWSVNWNWVSHTIFENKWFSLFLLLLHLSLLILVFVGVISSKNRKGGKNRLDDDEDGELFQSLDEDEEVGTTISSSLLKYHGVTTPTSVATIAAAASSSSSLLSGTSNNKDSRAVSRLRLRTISTTNSSSSFSARENISAENQMHYYIGADSDKDEMSSVSISSSSSETPHQRRSISSSPSRYNKQQGIGASTLPSPIGDRVHTRRGFDDTTKKDEMMMMKRSDFSHHHDMDNGRWNYYLSFIIACDTSSSTASSTLPATIVSAMWISNMIGIACSRSLHYQFLPWYWHSLPLILGAGGEWNLTPTVTSATTLVGKQVKRRATAVGGERGDTLEEDNVNNTRQQLPTPLFGLALPSLCQLLLIALIEIAWNRHPPTGISSFLLTIVHFLIVFLFAFRDIAPISWNLWLLQSLHQLQDRIVSVVRY